MEHHGKARTPEEIAAAVAAAEETRREREMKRQRAGLLDVDKTDGALFMALVRELAGQRSAKGHRRPRLTVAADLQLEFHAKTEDEPLCFQIPADAELIRHPGGTYVLTDGKRSLRVNVNRRGDSVKLAGHSGFRELSGNRTWRNVHGTRYTRNAASRI